MCPYLAMGHHPTRLEARLRAHERRLFARCGVEPTEQVVRLLEIVGLADRGLVFAEREEALKALDAD